MTKIKDLEKGVQEPKVVYLIDAFKENIPVYLTRNYCLIINEFGLTEAVNNSVGGVVYTTEAQGEEIVARELWRRLSVDIFDIYTQQIDGIYSADTVVILESFIDGKAFWRFAKESSAKSDKPWSFNTDTPKGLFFSRFGDTPEPESTFMELLNLIAFTLSKENPSLRELKSLDESILLYYHDKLNDVPRDAVILLVNARIQIKDKMAALEKQALEMPEPPEPRRFPGKHPILNRFLEFMAWAKPKI